MRLYLRYLLFQSAWLRLQNQRLNAKIAKLRAREKREQEKISVRRVAIK
jgi:hypothetical protein